MTDLVPPGRIVLWICALCDRVEREALPECCGKHVRLGERAEQEHEPTPMFAVPYVRQSAIPTTADHIDPKVIEEAFRAFRDYGTTIHGTRGRLEAAIRAADRKREIRFERTSGKAAEAPYDEYQMTRYVSDWISQDFSSTKHREDL
jgi:hypothetical protein